MRRRLLLGSGLALALGGGRRARAQAPQVFRISTENTPAHFQTRVVQRFADTLAVLARGRLAVEFHPGAQLFRDQDVVRALSEGKVEMAVPGNWQLDRYCPQASLLTLPLLMGRSAAQHHALRDGPLGRQIADHLAESLQVVVPGRWIDLGHAQVFTVRQPVRSHQDMAGLHIRIAGGTAIAAQLSAVGALPSVVAWPDLPAVFRQGRLDGLISTFETIASARLWEVGLQHASTIQAYFAQYIPLVARDCWERLDGELRSALRRAWESVVDEARQQAQDAQAQARRTLEEHGLRVLEPDAQALAAWRRQALRVQDALARQLGIPPALLEQARRALEAAP